MYIKLDPQSDFPIYSQLIHQLMEGILKGDLKEGDMLPSVRSLAADLGINMHTVNKSYHELEKEASFKLFLNQEQLSGCSKQKRNQNITRDWLEN